MRQNLRDGNAEPVLEEFRATAVIRDSVLGRMDTEPAK
jgi:hypothetical protein